MTDDLDNSYPNLARLVDGVRVNEWPLVRAELRTLIVRMFKAEAERDAYKLALEATLKLLERQDIDE